MSKQIGIFWIFDNKIFYKTQKLEDIKSINGFKDSDLAHYQVWDTIKKQYSKFYLYEYEDIPRGRVIYDVGRERFIIYCDENILKANVSRELILEKFGLIEEKVVFKDDEHYKICKG